VTKFVSTLFFAKNIFPKCQKIFIVNAKLLIFIKVLLNSSLFVPKNIIFTAKNDNLVIFGDFGHSGLKKVVHKIV
jgi:hypothetical protein